LPGEAQRKIREEPGEAQRKIREEPGEAQRKIREEPGEAQRKTREVPGEAQRKTREVLARGGAWCAVRVEDRARVLWWAGDSRSRCIRATPRRRGASSAARARHGVVDRDGRGAIDLELDGACRSPG
jgi:hypothetical protein